MADKQVTIRLEEDGLSNGYRVKSLVNSIEFRVGHFLSREDVRDLIDHRSDTRIEVRPKS